MSLSAPERSQWNVHFHFFTGIFSDVLNAALSIYIACSCNTFVWNPTFRAGVGAVMMAYIIVYSLVLDDKIESNYDCILIYGIRSRPAQIFFGKLGQTPRPTFGQIVARHQFSATSDIV